PINMPISEAVVVSPPSVSTRAASLSLGEETDRPFQTRKESKKYLPPTTDREQRPLTPLPVYPVSPVAASQRDTEAQLAVSYSVETHLDEGAGAGAGAKGVQDPSVPT